ncbi:UNKL isoform 13 [Pan troglodytes]|uniref:UNKL isoform 13 n=1 Tax=Pan troglodytes TaxID=9598 RepID=A0A2J8J7Y7_PANTR|nr:UNKL isoform 13 [Pan troglodytes]
MTPPQQPPPLRSEPGTLGSAASSYSPLGECRLPPCWHCREASVGLPPRCRPD